MYNNLLDLSTKLLPFVFAGRQLFVSNYIGILKYQNTAKKFIFLWMSIQDDHFLRTSLGLEIKINNHLMKSFIITNFHQRDIT